MNVSFEWTIRFGDLLVLLGGIATIGAFLFRSGGKIQKLQMAIENALVEIGNLKQEVSQIHKILTTLAVQDERLTMLTKWYDELRRGQGRISETRN